MVVSNDSPRSPEMIEKSQVVLPSSPPQSPDMGGRKQPHNHHHRHNARDGNRRSSNSKKPPLAPPRPPPVVEQESPPSHLHTLGSSEDLSFADFSNLEDDGDNQQFASLSGFLEDDGNNLNNNNKNNPHYNSNNPTALRGRRHKVAATDVASVGNASDTQISVHSNTTGRDLHEKAKVAFNAGDYNAALPMFESILGAQVRRFSPLHPSVGAAMHNVGVCRQRLGQHALAENLFVEAVQIREQTLGVDHLEVAASLSKLGAAQTALGKYDDAFVKLRRALKISRDALGHEHKTVAQMLCHLACLYFEAGELMSSEASFQDALEIYRRVWSSAENRDACMTQLTDTLLNVGSIQNRRKRFAAAVESFSEALDLQRGIVGLDESRVISTLDNLGYSYSKMKDYNAALSCYRKMYRAQLAQSVTFTSACYETFRKEILMFEKQRRYQEAIDETKEVLQTVKSMLPRDHAFIVHTKELLSELKQKLRSSSEVGV